MFKHILVPTDGSKLSLKAVKAAIGLAGATKAKVTAFHVIAPYSPPTVGDGTLFYIEALGPEQYRKATELQAEKLLSRVRKLAADSGVACSGSSATHAQPWAAIIAAARSKRCDLVVMASHGRRGLAGLLLGSETTKVLTHSKTPVMVVR